MSTNQQTAAQPIDLDSLPLYFNREYYRVEDVRAALARQQPVARVDRIISASGLAEVSVFLESALKVGTVFYAAAPAAPHAQAAPVDQGQVLRTLRTLIDGSQPKDVPGALIVIDHALKNGIAWSYDMSPPAGFMAYVKANYAGDIYFHDPEWHAVRLWNAAMKNIGPRLAAPVPQEAEQAATAAVTAPAGVTLKAIRAHDSKEWLVYIEHPFGTSYVRMGDRRDLQLAELIACQPAAPAVMDAARGVLADDRYLNDDCDAPMRNGACTECGFGPCRRTQSKE